MHIQPFVLEKMKYIFTSIGLLLFSSFLIIPLQKKS